MTAQTSPRSRADINRANSQHSTGPTSPVGKARSSQNSFKHGLYSQHLIHPGEDPAEFDELRASLRREHQPASTTEEILVDELAQSFWRMRRFRQLDAHAWQPENLNSSIDSGMMTLVHRFANSAERSLHKTLAALTKLQKRDQADAPGFVSQKTAPEPTTAEEIGFVSKKTAAELEAFEYFGYYPEDMEKYVESLVDSRMDSPDRTENCAENA